jgi:hypothetical protein
MEFNRAGILVQNQRAIFYGIWIILGVFQAALTELQDDEAYYWVFSKYPDWGYFDHPPLIAILIKAGYAIFPNEFGVRFFPFLLHLLTLFILESLTRKQPRQLFFMVVLSMAVFQLSGFLAVPDTPLLFATALFFLCYRRLLEKKDLAAAILLGLSAALLLYSKYHGALVIFFTVISNPRLLLQYRIYVAGLIALLLFTPHLVWQFEHNWVSFRYHLLESNVNEYKPSFTLSYLAGQFILAGPIAGLILLPAALLYRSKDLLDRALKFTLLGVYLFFLLSSFRGKVEMNWTAPVLIPLVILSCKFLTHRSNWARILRISLPLSMVVVIAARVIMVKDLVPLDTIRKKYHAWKEWPADMKRKTGNSPIVFSNSYQRASKYWFYTGQVTYSQNLYKEHRNQYNFWPIEDSLLGTPIHYLDIYDINRLSDSLKTPLGIVGFRRDMEFRSFARVKILPGQKKYEIQERDSLSVDARISMPAAHRTYLAKRPAGQCRLLLTVFDGNEWQKDIPVLVEFKHLLGPDIHLKFFPGLQKGKYRLMFALQTEGYHPTHNSEKFSLTIR